MKRQCPKGNGCSKTARLWYKEMWKAVLSSVFPFVLSLSAVPASLLGQEPSQEGQEPHHSVPQCRPGLDL